MNNINLTGGTVQHNLIWCEPERAPNTREAGCRLCMYIYIYVSSYVCRVIISVIKELTQSVSVSMRMHATSNARAQVNQNPS